MAVLAGATASGRQMYAGVPATTATTVYTSPAASTNVTSPSATAYVKEIIITNTTSSSALVNISLGAYYLISNLSVGANDTKILSGLNTMMPATTALQIWQATANAIQVTISGVEVQ